MKIIDAFTFFNETEILKLRLSLLYEKVDAFVICESNITHSGQIKKYNFLEQKNEFARWMDKITFLQYEPDISQLDFFKKDTDYNPSSAPWKIETGQRDFIASALVTQNPEDVAIICDVDEIWNPNLADFLLSGKIKYEVAKLEMQFHYYFFNCIGVGLFNSKWYSSYLARISYIQKNQNLSNTRVHIKSPIIGNGGWHFSYLGGAERVSGKINSFAHQETNTPEINNLLHLKRCINLGIDHLNRPEHEWAFRPLDFYPEPLRSEMMKFPHLIKSSLI
jgi:beta-1,4-mannosyl-glycoprotein beta-1,4-N-acetylglucosaminyltransferase